MDDGVPGRPGALYRVDPRVFRDGDNDGVGDLIGLIAELDYLRMLGVDGLWLASSSPPLPRGVASLVPDVDLLAAAGSPALFGLLTREAHRRGLRVLLDIDPIPERASRREAPAQAKPRAEDGGPGRTATRAAGPTAAARRWLDIGADAVWTGGEWQMTWAPAGSESALVRGLASPSVLFAADSGPVGHPLCPVCADPAHCAAPPSSGDGGRWEPRRLVAAMTAARAPVPEGSPLWVLSEPGAPRACGWMGPGLARLAATLLLTLPGIAVVTGGDEVGVVDGFPGPEVGRRTDRAGRTPDRAPMPWDERPNGGFASEPWRPLVGGGVAPVSRQRRDPDSLLSFHRRLIALRWSEPTLVHGSVSPVLAEGDVLAYLVEGPGNRVLVALNGGEEPTEVPLHDPLSGHVVLATDRRREGLRTSAAIRLGPMEAVVIRLIA